MNETSKIRDIVLKYCNGTGVDVGCGDEKIKSDSIGIDGRNLPGVNYVGIIENLSCLGDIKYDYMFSSHFLEHIKRPDTMINEMVRVLKPGGFMIHFRFLTFNHNSLLFLFHNAVYRIVFYMYSKQLGYCV